MKNQFWNEYKWILLAAITGIAIIICTACGTKEDKQNAVMESQEKIQEAEWQVEQGDEAVMGSNLIRGNSTVEGIGSVYVLDIGMYGGKPLSEDECYNIYEMKEGEWEVFASHYPYSADVNSISNLVYLDGYIYYALRETDRRGYETNIYRFSKEDEYVYKSPDCLISCDNNFYVYKGGIYFKRHKEGTRYFYKMKLDGKDVEELYSDNQEDSSDYDYTVGGGCLYLKEEEQILGINLKTGERKGFKTDAEHIDGLFFENGRLYIYDSENGEVYQMDVKTGNESKIMEGNILLDCVWIHDGFLYYVEEEKGSEEFYCSLKAMNVITGEDLLWKSVSFDMQPYDAGLEVVEDRVIASFCVKKENETEEYQYFEKEIREITDAEYKKSMEMLSNGEEDEKKITVIQEGFQGSEWPVKQDDEVAIGYNFRNSAISTEGNGCIYSTDMGMYGGTPAGEDDRYNIYRLKEGKWELFISHPIEEEPWYVELSVYNLTYYNGYIYYILLRDFEPAMGSSGKDYTICRVSEKGGTVEKLAKCNGNFYIYQDEIYYDSLGQYEDGRYYFRVKLDGSDKELLYFDKGKDYLQFAYTVGGNCLYLCGTKQIMGISLENDKEKFLKYFEVPAKFGVSIFYEDGKLYIFDCANPEIYQLDVRTGDVSKVLGEYSSDLCREFLENSSDFRYSGLLEDFLRNHSWIYNGYLYYIDYGKTAEGDSYDFKVMDLSTREIITWGSAFFENESVTHLEVTESRVIIRVSVKDKNENFEQKYFVKEISEIMGSS